MTELILHGYVAVILPRTGRAPEIVIRSPGGGLAWLDAHQIDLQIAKLERELEVMRAARAMVVEASALSVRVDDGEQIQEGDGHPLTVEVIYESGGDV